MPRFYEALILIATLAGAVIIGKWFRAEVYKARQQNKPWYTPYFSIPGLVIVVAISLPILYWLLHR